MKKCKLLIADDNKGVLKALQLLLKSEFEVIRTISSTNQLYTELDRTDFDVVLLDMNFKAGVNTGNEGLFWLKEIKKRSPGVEVVMITAYGDVELAVRSLKEGAVDFVLKPWDNDKLKATLDAACRLRNSNVEIVNLKSRERLLKQDANRRQSDDNREIRRDEGDHESCKENCSNRCQCTHNRRKRNRKRGDC